MRDMPTTANIEFFGLEICCEDDGYPETVEPYLEDLRQKIIALTEASGLSIGQASAVVLYDEFIDNPQERSFFARGSYSYPNYEYKVTKEEVTVF